MCVVELQELMQTIREGPFLEMKDSIDQAEQVLEHAGLHFGRQPE